MKHLKVMGIIILILNIVLFSYAFLVLKADETVFFSDEKHQFNEGWEIKNVNASDVSVTLPHIINGKNANPVTLENTLPSEYAGMTMTFDAECRQMRVTVDGEVIYQTNSIGKNYLGDVYGNGIYLINLPSKINEGKITIELWQNENMPEHIKEYIPENITPQVEPQKNIALPPLQANIKIGSVTVAKRDTSVLVWIKDNFAKLGCSVFLLANGIIFSLLIIIQRISRQKTEGMLYMCLFCLDASLYYLLDTKILNLFFGNTAIYSLIGYSCLMIMPFLLIAYYGKTLIELFPKRFNWLVWLSSANIAVQILLQFAGVCSFQDMVLLSHLVIFFTIVVEALCLVQIIKNKYGRSYILLECLAVFLLFSQEISDFILKYILADGNTYKYSCLGIAAYGVIMMLVHFLRIAKGYSSSIAENARLLEGQVEEMERKNAELKKARDEAEDAKQQAIIANEAKGKFLANMSHEIRTPINAVLGMDAMILRESSEEDIKGYAMDIQSAGQSLLSLINDILDSSKIDSGKMEIIPVEYDLSSLINDIMNMITVKAEAKDLELKLEIDQNLPSRLFGDDVRIRQVLVNILTNAVKYTPEGSVTIRVNGKIVDDGEYIMLHYEVQDTGIGIKQEDIEKLFVAFERIEEKRNRNIEGTGLGMNITTQLLRMMGSQLLVDSVYGEGSNFHFDLKQRIVDSEPIGDLEERIKNQAREFTYAASFAAPDAHVLVVDDNAVNRKVFRSLLKETKVQVDEADSGNVCLELAQLKQYDLIFLDHMMPEMDGIETLHHMRQMRDYPNENTPIIILTANAVSGAKEMYLSEGFDDFLSKPINPDKLEKLMQNMLPKDKVVLGAPKKDAQLSKTTHGADALPQVEGVDWNYGFMHIPDVEFLLGTVRDFYNTIDSEADYLETRFNELKNDKDALNLYRIKVHAMKSSANLIGAVPIAGMAKVLEFAARDGRTDILEQMTPVFLEEWRSYKEKLMPCMPSEDKKEITDYSYIKELLDKLKNAMTTLDTDVADVAMEEIAGYKYEESVEKEVEKLQAAVTNLDEPLCKAIIEKLMEMLN